MTSPRLVTEIGLSVLKAREGVRLEAYRDSVGVWTIGWGHTKGVKPGDKITRAQAEAFLAEDIDTHAAPILDAVKVPLADHEADALVSIAFNIGVSGFKRSTFLRKLNAGDRDGCADAILQWDKPAEIIPRRQAEHDQFLTPYDVALPKARRTDRNAVGGTKTRAPAKPRLWAEQMLSEEQIRYVQERLIALGYHEVGLVDGIWAPDGKVSAAVKLLQARARAMGENVKVDGHYGPQTKNLIDPIHNARYRNVPSPQRSSTTANDLWKRGTPGVVQGRKIQWASLAGLVFSLIGMAWSAWQTPAELPPGASIALAFLPPWVSEIAPFLLTFGASAYTAIKGSGLVGTAVDRFQEGIDNTGLPPETERQGPGGLLGSLFRK